eukprot:167667_1
MLTTDYTKMCDTFKHFLLTLLITNSDHKNRRELSKNYVDIDFQDLQTFDQQLAHELQEHPSIYLPLFDKTAKQLAQTFIYPKPHLEDMDNIQIQFHNLTEQPIPIRELQLADMSQLVQVSGNIVSISPHKCMPTQFELRCKNCSTRITSSNIDVLQIYCIKLVHGYVREMERQTNLFSHVGADVTDVLFLFISNSYAPQQPQFGSISIPRTCGNATCEKNDTPCPLNPFEVVTDTAIYVDVQQLKLQEISEDIPTGEMPRHIWLVCERKLVNKVKAGIGARVNITGIYKIPDGFTVHKPYIEVIGIEQVNLEQKSGSFTAAEEETIQHFSRSPNIHRIIQNSISPAIEGHKDIKLAIATLLFGGNMKLRGD